MKKPVFRPHKRPLRLAFLAAALFLGATGVFFNTRNASGATTAELCDQPFAKYYCSKVDYVSDPSPQGDWVIATRWVRGGVDGGADRWHVNMVNDWEWINNQWNLTWNCWDCTNWETNVPLGPWQSVGPSRNVVWGTAVQFQTEYIEFTPPGEPNNVWCSGVMEHYLWNGTSFETSPAVCY